MQQVLDTLAPLIGVCIMAVVLIAIALVAAISRMRLWGAQRREIELRSSKYRQVAQANIDAVTQMIGEMAARPATYDTMSSDVSEALYAARRAAAEL